MTTPMTQEQLIACWCSGDFKTWMTLAFMFALGVFVGGAGVALYFWSKKRKG